MRRLGLPLFALAAFACTGDTLPVGPSSPALPPLPAEVTTASSSGYTAIDLGTLGGGRSDAFDVNDAGQVVGSSWTTAQGPAGPETHAFFWDGTMQDLGTPAVESYALLLNNVGQVVGGAEDASGYFHVVIWEDGVITDLGVDLWEATDVNEAGQVVGGDIWADPGSGHHAFLYDDGVVHDLGTLGSGESGDFSHARAVNETGQVVGSSSAGWGGDWVQAFLWENGELTDLGDGTTYYSEAFDVNDGGQVVGFMVDSEYGAEHAFLWDPSDGEMHDLGTLGGIDCVYCESRALDVNNTGLVVGYSITASGQRHAFLWENGVMHDLGTLGGAGTVEPTALNEAGQVVGRAYTASGQQHAFLWENGVMHDLGTLGGNHSIARAVNEGGHVVGASQTETGEWHAALWRPLEPVERIGQVAVLVEQLLDEGAINSGQCNSLLNKLNIATAMLNDGKVDAAINVLGAFINAVEALMSGNNPVLTPEQGQLLIDEANSVIAQLGG